MGVQNQTDRQVIKKRIKELKTRVDREKKTMEKDAKARAAAAKKK